MKVAIPNTHLDGDTASRDDDANRKPFEGVELTWQLLLIAKYTRAFMVAKLDKIGIEAGQDQFIQALPIEGSMGSAALQMR